MNTEGPPHISSPSLAPARRSGAGIGVPVFSEKGGSGLRSAFVFGAVFYTLFDSMLPNSSHFHGANNMTCPLLIPAIDISLSSWQVGDGGMGPPESLRMIPHVNSPPIELDWRGVRQCLRGRRIAFVGDSVSRYQYLNLVHFLAWGSWYSSFPRFENEQDWGSWTDFFVGTSSRLVTPNTRESCDCGREFKVENRAFFDSAHNFTITFTQYVEGIASRGIDPRLLTLTECTDSAGCLQGGCSPGECNQPTWSFGGHVELLDHVAVSLAPDTIIFNSGLWPHSGFDTPERIKDLLRLAVSLKWRGVKDLIWKTTTRTDVRKEDLGDSFRNPGFRERDTLLPALATHGAKNSSWRVFDAYALTKSLDVLDRPVSLFFWDHVHLQPPVYRGLNEVLLADLLRKF